MLMRRSSYPDGTRLHCPDKDKLWLVFNGICHHVVDNDVYSRLFSPNILIEHIDSYDGIREGAALLFGTCLVNGEGRAAYLLAVHPNKIKLHPILSFKVFDKYGFDHGLCRALPSGMVDSIARGPALT